MPSYTVHTVQKGDTLYTIARQHNTTVDTLVRLNALPDPSRLAVGQRLRVPRPPMAPDCAPGAPSCPPPRPDRPPMQPPTPRPPREEIYVVQPGDTLGDIAFRFGTTVPVLLRLNGLSDTEDIRPGQELRVPALPPQGDNIYVVQAGDTLFAIAAANGTTVDELVRLNNIRTPNLIFPGDRIRLR